MKSLKQHIVEALSPNMDAWLDEISDWCEEPANKAQFKIQGLARAGWESSIPYGEHRCAALVWNGRGETSNSVLLMTMPEEETENSGVFKLICAGNADPRFRRFSTVGDHEFILHRSSWKSELSDALNWFWSNEFKKS